MKHVIAIILTAASFSACATRSSNPAPDYAAAKPNTPATDVSVGTLDNVRFGEVVKAYPIGRYRDPADPRIMHERHVVYRQEQSPAWRLDANRNQQIIVGNLVTDRRSARAPISSQELTAEVFRSRAQNAVIAEQQRVMVGAMTETARALQGMNASNDFLTKKLADLTVDVRQLKEKEEAERKRREQTTVPSGGEAQPPATSTNSNGTLQ